MTRLFAIRAKALATGRLSLLDTVDEPMSFAYDLDSASVRVLRNQHLHTRGFVQRVVKLTTEDFSRGWVVLSVITTIPPYSVVDRAGHVVAERVGRTQRFGMTIERRHGRWMIQSFDREPIVAPRP